MPPPPPPPPPPVIKLRWPQLQLPNGLIPLLSACKGDKKTSLASQIHALLITTNTNSSSSATARLIASYARAGLIVFARRLFDSTPQPGVDVWNSMIVAYSRANCPRHVLSLYRAMITRGLRVRPDSSTFTVALKACSSLVDLEMGEEIWAQAMDFGYGGDVFVASSILNLYVKCGKLDQAKAVLDNLVKRDVVCWTTTIMGLVHGGRAVEALDMYRMMQNEGVEGDGVLMVGLIHACASLGDLKLGLSVHGYMVRRQLLVNDVIAQTSLVDMYAKNGHLELASRVFMDMPRKNDVSWGALISGFARNGFPEDAFQLLVKMQASGFRPDSASLVSSLSACSQVRNLVLGKSLHGYIVRRVNFQRALSTALIDMYAKCGSLSCARVLFDRVDSKDLILWNVMIACYGNHGHGKEALSLFLKMRETNLKPDHATFASLLSALGHSGLVKEGKYLFDAMVNKYKIQPSEKHYACMVDLLARAGKVEEACQLIETMNTEPGLAIWVALLSGCYNNGKLLVGEIAAKKILESNPEDLGIYALVSNFFSLARKWDEAAVLRTIMKMTGKRKAPGYSAVEVNGKHEAFLMEDTNLHQYPDVIQILNSLDNQIKAIKYVLGPIIFAT